MRGGDDEGFSMIMYMKRGSMHRHLRVLFFFFKQKTAYEMCGRDWSSDVCSSDLTKHQTLNRQTVSHGILQCSTVAMQHGERERRREKIGRASCRERV